MAVELAVAYVSIAPSLRDFRGPINKELGAAEKSASNSGQTIGKNLGNGFANTFKKIAGPALAVLGAGAISSFAKGAVSAFSELEDSTAAAGVVFGDSMQKIIDQAAGASKSMGLTKQQVINAANTFGTYGKAAGLSGDALADFATKQAQLAADMASFKGTSPEQAIEAIGAALRGETEPIRAYGVMLDDASLKNQALAMGLISTTKDALSPQNKTLAAQALILKQTADAQGDFARTSDSTANVAKTLSAQTEDLSAKFGMVLAPAFTNAREKAIGFVGGITGVLDKVLAFQGALAAGAMTPDLVKALGLDPSQGFGAAVNEGIGGIRAFGASWKANDGDITSSGFAGWMEMAAFKLRGFLDAAKDAAATFTASLGPSLREMGPPLLALFLALSPLGIAFEALGPVLPQLAQAAANLALTLSGVLVSALTALAPIVASMVVGVADFFSSVTSTQGGVDGLTTVVVIAGAAWVAYKGYVIASSVATKAAAASQWLMNAAMTANPIGIVVVAIAALVAGLVYFFTQTELGQKVIETVWGSIQSFIGGVVTWFQTYVLPVVQTVFNAVGAVFSWLYDNVIKPVFNLIKWAIQTWWTIVSGIFEVVVAIVKNVLGPIFKWLYDSIIKPVFDLIVLAIKVFWENKVKPIFDAVSWFIKNVLGPAFSWLYDNVIKPVWDFISDKISSVWNDKIKPVFSSLEKGVEALPAAFELAKSGIATAWDAIREAVKKPIRAVIGFINEGLIDRFNTIPGVDIDQIKMPPGFQKGGYTGDGAASEFAGHVHKGEYVFTKAQTAAIGKDRLASLADGAASGRLADGSSALFFGGLQQSFKDAGAAYVRSVGAGSWNIPGAASLWDGAAGLKVRAGNGSPSMTATQRPLGNQILGYAYSNGDISLASGWVNQLSPTQRRTTAAHEIGHVLGLPHNSGMRSIMHPNLASQSPVPTGTDIRNLQALYPGGTGRAGAGNENPFDGLVDALAGKLKAAFPGGGMFIDAAAGLAKTGIEQVVKIVTDIKNGIKEIAGNVFGKVKEFFGGGASTTPTLYDNGGVLSPNGGRPQLVQNKTGKPEYIFTNRDMQALASGNGGAQIVIQGNVGWQPDQVAQQIEVQKRRAQTMAGMDGVVFA